ncbi:aminoglycoside phosphotransferase family protein [Thermoactinomyces mirandus]|nr:aminoglycoside phosphotransferase family protein [Thermoactinomyces mirandus]
MKDGQNHQSFMKESLMKAASYFDVQITGKMVFGWNDRSIGSKVKNQKGICYWLRVVSEMMCWAQGDFWEGNLAANKIKGITKPRVIQIYEWEDGGIQLRAELMSFVEGRVCAFTPELRTKLDLSPRWLSELRASLDRLSFYPTERIHTKQEKVTRRFLVFYGDKIDSNITKWTTAHGDLHWANLMAPQLSILDWEGWGKAPLGYDAATLYCFSLLIPEVAEQVYQTFADILDTHEGVLAQLYVITRLLHRIDLGDFMDLAGPLHRHADDLLARLKRC